MCFFTKKNILIKVQIMDDHKKEGISVKDIENFTRQHRFEVFFCLAFVLAFFFGLIMYGAWWSVLATIVGAIVGMLLPQKTSEFSRKAFAFFQKQEKTVQLILGIVLLILAVFLPPLIFLIIGLHGGKDIFSSANDNS